MKCLTRLIPLMIIISLTMLFTGCAKPPEAEKAAAKTAMDTSLSAGADKYAAADLDAAKKVWDAAESQMSKKEYKEARLDYIKAKAAFEKTTVVAGAGKKAAVDEANTALAGLEEAWNSLSKNAKNFENKLKDKKNAWDADSDTIRKGISSVKDEIANDPIGAKAKAGELRLIIEKWDTNFKELAAASVKAESSKKKSVISKKKKSVHTKKTAHVKKKSIKKKDVHAKNTTHSKKKVIHAKKKKINTNNKIV